MSQRKHSLLTREHAWFLYASGQASMPQIAEQLGVPYGTIHTWHQRDKWVSRSKQIESEAIDVLREDFGKKVLHKGFEVIRNQLQISGLILERVSKKLERDDLSAADLEILAKIERNVV